MKRRLGGVIATGLVVIACSGTATPRPTTALGTLAVPTLDTRGAYPCAGVGTEGVLTGDANDPRVAWLSEAGHRVDVVFPYGFSARFTPNLEVLGPSGAVVARGGDRVDGGCVTAGPLLILWP
jgi:hypothetical protein